ncbi:uncharacterized protein [Aegilops tauschii subsp. strangulata]|uniref:uncharacterized protein n=1 Tax=Aegilops tauschii subsp. strangulata TaxID=200361 RepID=UPI003CC8AF4B
MTLGPHVVACILGVSQVPASGRHAKQLFCRVNAARPQPETPRGHARCEVAITFGSRDHPESVAATYELPMLCTPTISNLTITKTLINGGAGLNVLSVQTFEMLLVPYDQLLPTRPFSGETKGSATPLGHVRLPVAFGKRDNYRIELINFNVFRIGLPYNVILASPDLAKFMAVTHPGYNIIKMSGSSGVITMAGDKEDVFQALKLAHRAPTASRPDIEGTLRAPEAAPARKKQLFSQDRTETKRVPVDDDNLGPAFTIGTGLPSNQEQALFRFLRANKGVFAWKVSDLVGDPREVIEHHLAVCPNTRPVKHKVRHQAQEKQAFIVKEVRELHEAGVIWEVQHPGWLANPIVVPKKGGRECMCVDFMSLNKACPQDPFSLPRIDQIVDYTVECDLMCFLDSFSGYHQIKMAAEDVEKTTFISLCGVYYYTWMPFGLRSVGATFQRIITTTGCC